MVTIGQIAKMAGVSKSTVSRVLNSSGYVRKETRDKIEKLIEEYHYSPLMAAKNLSRQETNTIGIIIPEWDNTFFVEVLAGITEILDENKMTMILSNTSNNSEKEREALCMMETQRVKGVIFTPATGYTDKQSSRNIRLQLQKLKIPVVLVDREIENVQWDGVFYENFRSTYLAVERLIEKGCSEIGIITGDMDLKHARERYRGYVQALEDHNLPLIQEYVYQGNYTLDGAYQITCDMFASGKWPQGLVLCNNETTLGFLKGMTESGKKLEQDIQIVGIDHIPVLDLVGYRYDCITRDAKAMGRMAMQLLIERFQNPKRERKNYWVPCIPKFNN